MNCGFVLTVIVVGGEVNVPHTLTIIRDRLYVPSLLNRMEGVFEEESVPDKKIKSRVEEGVQVELVLTIFHRRDIVPQIGSPEEVLVGVIESGAQPLFDGRVNEGVGGD